MELKNLIDQELLQTRSEMNICLKNGANEIYMIWLSYQNGLKKGQEFVDQLLNTEINNGD